MIVLWIPKESFILVNSFQWISHIGLQSGFNDCFVNPKRIDHSSQFFSMNRLNWIANGLNDFFGDSQINCLFYLILFKESVKLNRKRSKCESQINSSSKSTLFNQLVKLDSKWSEWFLLIEKRPKWFILGQNPFAKQSEQIILWMARELFLLVDSF